MTVTVGEGMSPATGDVGMTTAVTSTEDADMTAIVMITEAVATTMKAAGVCIGLIFTANRFTSRRRSTMNRRRHRASISFYHFNRLTEACLNVVRHIWQLRYI